jgi:hypothetical protein
LQCAKTSELSRSRDAALGTTWSPFGDSWPTRYGRADIDIERVESKEDGHLRNAQYDAVGLSQPFPAAFHDKPLPIWRDGP